MKHNDWYERGVPRSEVRDWLAINIGVGPDVIAALQSRIRDLEAELQKKTEEA